MLHLILGRTGSGKTEYVKRKIVDFISNGEKNITLLVPKHFSYVTGNAFLSALGEADYRFIDITDFDRLSNSVLNKYGVNEKTKLDDAGSAIIMSRAIKAVSDSLVLYKKRTSSPDFINAMLDAYVELKKSDVSIETLTEKTDDIERQVLRDKMHDISLIIGMYEAMLSDNFINSADDLNRLYDTLCRTDYLDGKTVFIDGFSVFSAQELKIIERFICSAKDVYMTFCCDSLHDNDNGFGVFSNIKKCLARIIQIAKSNNVAVSAPVVLEDNKKHSGSLKVLERNFFFAHEEIEDAENDSSIVLYSAKNIYKECDYTARTIKNLLRTGDYRCRDIAVVARNTEKYLPVLQNAFNAYSIPYFEDMRQKVDTQPLIKFVYYTLKCLESFSTDDILSYAKTMLLSISVEEISELENYVFMWRISGKKWCDEFTNHPNGFQSEFTDKDVKTLERINNTRKTIVGPLLSLKKSIKDADCRTVCEKIYYHLLTTKANENLLTLAQSLEKQGLITLAHEQDRIWRLLMDMLDQIVLTCGDSIINIKEFIDIFTLTVASTDLGSIPQGFDNIDVTSAERASASSPKVAFILGANEGEFPRSVSQNGLLAEKDRQSLKEIGIELKDSNEKMIIEEKFLAYTAVTLPSEKLYVTYSTGDLSEQGKAPSSIVGEILSLFENIKVLTDADFDDIDLIEGERAAFEYAASKWHENTAFANTLKSYFYNKGGEYADRIKAIQKQNDQSDYAFERNETAVKLFGKDMPMSASRTEIYHKCPFMYFCRYGMLAQPRKRAELNPMELGTVAHFILEKMFTTYSSDGIAAMDKTALSENIVAFLRQYLVEEIGMADADERFKYQFMRIGKTLLLVFQQLAEEFEQSKFVTKACELPIDIDAPVKPVFVELESGGKLYIKGSVDRVDIMKTDDGDFVRVVDYKTGKKEFSLYDVLNGINMQMLIYLMCIAENKDGEFSSLIPAGVLYMPVRRDIPYIESRNDEKSCYEALSSGLCMNGMVLDNESVIRGMENDIKGKFIPVKLRKTISGSLILKKQLDCVFDEIKGILKAMGDELQKGNIPARPFVKSESAPCDYCDYASVCVNKQNKKHKTPPFSGSASKENEYALKIIGERIEEDGENTVDSSAT